MKQGAGSTHMRMLPDVGITPTVPALLAYAVQRFGDAEYIVLPDRRITFRDADRASRILARRLVELGVGKGARVAMLYPSSPEFVVAFFAIARVGAIAIFLSSTMKATEVRSALRLSDASALLAPRSLVGRDVASLLEDAVEGLAGAGDLLFLQGLPYLRRILIEAEVDRTWATPMSHAGRSQVSDALLAEIEKEVHPADELLMIWTSGSTATPKGVVHTHGPSVRKVAPSTGLGLRPSHPGRVFMTMPLFWVGGPQSLLGCLFSGATLLCQERFDAGEAIDLIHDGKADAIVGWRFMLDRLQEHPKWQKVSTVALEPPRSAPQSSRGASLNLGMTETFGRHLPGEHFEYRIVDPETGQILPDGEEGEFRVRGLSLMSRMSKRERDEVFDVDGFYPTGDKGYLENGHAFFTGRYSEIIKSAGANVSPTEVEAVIERFPEVQSVVVLGTPNAARGQDVAAVVCLRTSEAAITGETLIERCRRELSGYKLPRTVRFLSPAEFPMLASGKPDRRAIRTLMVPNAQGDVMRVRLDREKCRGHGRCYAIAPEIFGADEEGQGIVIRAEIRGKSKAQAEAAIANCPESAISFDE